jgi:hypothetical protein
VFSSCTASAAPRLTVTDSIRHRRPDVVGRYVTGGGRAGGLIDSRTEAERGYLAMTLAPADQRRPSQTIAVQRCGFAPTR